MRIDVEKITPKQKLTIAKGLCDYKYVMQHWKDDDADFRAVYFDFYLSARWPVMRDIENSAPYFEQLQVVSSDSDLLDVVDCLKEKMKKHSYEFSLVSKMLHTHNPRIPIYDKKVREYLSTEEKVPLWWQCKGAPSGKSTREMIEHDWNLLNAWYEEFFKTERAKTWIDWFDANFESCSDISNVKKIDFIIFATN